MALKTSEPEAPRREDEIDKRISESFEPGARDEFKRYGSSREDSLRDLQDFLAESEDGSSTQKASVGQDDIWDQEKNPAGWENKTTPRDAPQQKAEGIRGFFRVNKKKGPIGIIVTVLVGGVIGLSFLSSGLLLLHISETITDKMNMQFPSMQKRTNKILAKKILDQSTSGVCAGEVTVLCKYNTLNDRQLENFRRAGITVNLREDTTITGRHKPISMEFKGKTIEAANFEKLLREDPELRSAFLRAYNPKFAGFSDRVFAATARVLGINKAPTFKAGITNEERTETVKEKTKHGSSTGSTEGRRYAKNDKGEIVYEDDPNTRVTDSAGNYIDELTDADGNKIVDETIEAHNNGLGNTSIIKEGIDGISTSEEKLTGKALAAAQDSLDNNIELDAKSLAGGVLGGVAGASDAACSFYGMYRAVSFGAKTIRSVQMARYAMIFLNTASMIKSGDATPEDVSYLGDLLTKTVNEETTDETGVVTYTTTKAATDSYGYKYVAYGDTGPLTPSAAEFTAGGGLGGKMTGIANQILSVLPGDIGQKDVKRLCGVIKSPWGQAANLVISFGLIVFGGPVGWGALAATIGGGVVANIALSTAKTILTPILADMAAGILVDNSTFGEKAGDALISGSGVIMSTSARLGGNAPLKPEEAVAYTNIQQEVLAQYAEEERLTHSPFDPSSPYTFMGRIVGQLAPYSTQTKSVSSIVTTSFSVAKRSLATIFAPSAFAAENTAETFKQCDDMDYQELGLATDPFCNPIYGMPVGLDLDPDEVANYLISTGDINENGTVTSDRYKNFMTNCINRERPLGDSGDEFNLNTGSECFLDDKGDISKNDKTYFYIFQIDQRVLDGMENGYAVGSSSGGGTSNPTGGIGGGAGISAVWGGSGTKDLSYGFESPGVADWYGYGATFGTSGTGHTGTDIPMDPYAPVYSPVEGIVVCERSGVGPGAGGPNGPGCAGANDYSGPNSEWDQCRTGYDASKPSGAGTVMIKITKNGQPTGGFLVLGHLAGSLVKVNDVVKVNQQIGLAGCMNGWHTHVEYYTPSSLPSGLKLVDPVKNL